MSFRTRWARWLDERLPASLSDDARPRARVFVITVLFALTLTAISAVLAAVSALSVLAVLNLLAAIAAAGTLWAFKRRREPTSAVRFFLGFYTAFLSLGALATTPMELTMLSYLLVLPLLAAVMLDPKEAPRWFIRVLLAGAAATLVGHLGLVVPQVDPLPLANRIINFVATMVASMALLDALATESARSIERLREAERAKGAFFANIGHEIRTPMNGVLGMTDALLGRELGGEEREMAHSIRSSGQLMMRLLDDLLDLSRLEARRLVLTEHDVALAPFGLALRAAWAPLAEQNGLTLTVTLEPSLPPAVRLDELRLRQVLGNLVSNALKFTEPGGKIAVRLWAEQERLCCAVKDSGIGISPKQQPRLFDRFVQADDGLGRRHQGSGLGLALSRELAVHMGGTLELESTVGQGSCFTCRFPLVPAALPEAKVEAPRQLQPGLRVLVVDDNAVNRLVAQRLLQRSACQVEVAVDGPSAMAALTRGGFDLVLMDVHMPGMDGLEVTRRFRASGHGTGLPIIGVSASAATEDIEGCRQAGMNDFLAKPVTHERLVATLLRHAGRGEG